MCAIFYTLTLNFRPNFFGFGKKKKMNFKEILTPECLFKETKNGPDTSTMASNPELYTTVCGVTMKKYGQNSESTKSAEILSVTNFLILSSIKPQLELICHAINYKKPVLIKGPVGSGKSAIVQHVVNSVGRISPPSFVTVQLGEHMDSRVIVTECGHCCFSDDLC